MTAKMPIPNDRRARGGKKQQAPLSTWSAAKGGQQLPPQRGNSSMGLTTSSLLASSSLSRITASRSSMASSRVMKPKEPARLHSQTPVVVLNSKGEDVTPRPFLVVNESTKALADELFGSQQSKSSYKSSKTSTQHSLDAVNAVSEPFTRSILGSGLLGERSSQATVRSSMASSTSTVRALNLQSRDESGGGFRANFGAARSHVADAEHDIPLTEAELDEDVRMTFTETETFWLLDIPGTCVARDSDEANEVHERNNNIKKRRERRVGSEWRAKGGMQTFNNALKTKQNQTFPVNHETSAAQASTSNIYDTFLKERRPGEESAQEISEAKEPDPKLVLSGSDENSKKSTGTGTTDSLWSMMSTSVAPPMLMDSAMIAELDKTVLPPTEGDSSEKNDDGKEEQKDDVLPIVRSDHAFLKENATALVSSLLKLERRKGLDKNREALASFRHSQNLRKDLKEAGKKMNIWPINGKASQEEEVTCQVQSSHLSAIKAINAANAKKIMRLHSQRSAFLKRMSSISSQSSRSAGSPVPICFDLSRKFKGNLTEMLPSISKQIADRLRKEYQPVINGPLKASSAPCLKKLWTWSCSLTKGYTVCCMAWNKHKDLELLAVGYGSYDFTKQRDGYICCWPLNNTEYPERMYHLPCSVVSLDFSKSHPSLLAAGLYDGSVSIFNVRQRGAEEIMSNRYMESTTKHRAPVKQVRWVMPDKDSQSETDEMLVSIAPDGRVIRWSVFKGFDGYELMRLRRPTKKLPPGSKHTLHQTASLGRSKTEGLIQRHASGFCLDFRPDSSNIYLVGTEEGYLHQCSCSYNEQYLETYISHISVVYRALWSPFNKRQFLSCSDDWTVCIWDLDQSEPIFTFKSGMKAVLDAAWCPIVPDVFACVLHGRIEVWDLKSGGNLDPVIVHEPASGLMQTQVLFARSAQALVVGDADGQVTVYQVCGLPSFVKILKEVLQVDEDQAMEDAIAEFEADQSN